MSRQWWVCVTLAAAGLAGCSAPQQVPVAALPAAEDATDWRTRDDLLALRMRALAGALQRDGWQPSEDAWEGFLPTSTRQAMKIDVPRGRCRVLVAVGAPGIADLDASLFTARGDALAQDSGSDSRPALHICAGDTDRQAYYVLHAYQGSGAFLIVAYDGSPKQVAALQRTLGQDTEGAHGESASGDEGALAGLVRGLVRRGFETEGSDASFALRSGERIQVALGVELGRCYAALAMPGKGLRNVVVTVRDEAGAELARDAATRSTAGVQFCPVHGGAYMLTVESADGQGDVTVARFSGPSHVVGGERGMWLGDRGGAQQTSRIDDAWLRSEGYGSAKVVARGRLAPGEAVEHANKVGGGCTLFEVTAEPSLAAVELRVTDAEGRDMAEASSRVGHAFVHVCGAARPLYAQVVSRAGFGGYTLATRSSAERSRRVVAKLPEGLRMAALDALRGLQAQGWSLAGEPVSRLAISRDTCAADVSGTEVCLGSKTYEVSNEACTHVVALSSTSSVLLELSAKGQPTAQATSEGVTRCAHDGRVEARVRVPASAADDLFLLRVERPR